MGKVLFSGMKIFPLGGARSGAVSHSVNLGPPDTSESIIARKLKFYTHADRSGALSGNENNPAGDVRQRSALRRNFGTHWYL